MAAIRETFEETGIWLGDGIMLEASREALMSSTASFRDVLATAEACLNLDCLYPWSWWVTPKIEPRRYDTRFFIAFTDAVHQGLHDSREAVNHKWVTPEDALSLAEQGQFPLAPLHGGPERAVSNAEYRGGTCRITTTLKTGNTANISCEYERGSGS